MEEINRDEIGVLLFVTQTPDYESPSTACVLHKRLGLSKECIAFDVNLGCSGFVFGLNIASSLLHSSKARYALVLVGDTLARKNTLFTRVKASHAEAMLFGDSGTATLLEKAGTGSLLVSSHTDGNSYKAIIHPYGWWRHPEVSAEKVKNNETMDDIAVFNFATIEAVRQINDYLKDTGTSPDDYDCLVLHQANKMIIKRIGKKTGFPDEKNLVSIDTFANTSGASIPVTLVKTYGDLNEDRRIRALCCGYGVGLSWATAVVDMNVRDIYPFIHTDDYYDDGFTHI